MKQKVDTCMKAAKDLRVGDSILSNRMTVVEVADVVVSEYVNLVFIDQGCACFKKNDLVLVLEGGYGVEP